MKAYGSGAIRTHDGMTLIELLVAMAIFAVMTSSMFIAFDSFQRTKEVTEANAERLKRYQYAFNIISKDLNQLNPRSVRDEFGSEKPLYAFRAESDSAIEFTRSAWNRSPFSKVHRSELQRVSYYLEDNNLMRAYWRVLDRAEDTVPTRTKLLEGVTRLSFEFHYRNDQNTPSVSVTWPPDSMITGNQPTPSLIPDREFLLLPQVVDIKLETDDMGPINRKYLVANCMVDVLKPNSGSTPQGGGCEF